MIDPAIDAPVRSLRKVPVQDRGRRRVEAILDAAASVIARVGVEAATINAIADEAATAKGSLYQFFPSKDAIVAALAVRYAREVNELQSKLFPADPSGLPLDRIVAGIFDSLAAYHDANPAYRHVFTLAPSRRGPSIDSVVRREWEALNRSVVERVRTLVTRLAPHLGSDDVQLHALVLVTAGESLLALRDDTPKTRRRALLQEVTRLCCAYLAPIVASPTAR